MHIIYTAISAWMQLFERRSTHKEHTGDTHCARRSAVRIGEPRPTPGRTKRGVGGGGGEGEWAGQTEGEVAEVEEQEGAENGAEGVQGVATVAEGWVWQPAYGDVVDDRAGVGASKNGHGRPMWDGERPVNFRTIATDVKGENRVEGRRGCAVRRYALVLDVNKSLRVDFCQVDDGSSAETVSARGQFASYPFPSDSHSNGGHIIMQDKEGQHTSWNRNVYAVCALTGGLQKSVERSHTQHDVTHTGTGSGEVSVRVSERRENMVALFAYASSSQRTPFVTAAAHSHAVGEMIEGARAWSAVEFPISSKRPIGLGRYKSGGRFKEELLGDRLTGNNERRVREGDGMCRRE
ncbi:uncharacterized protein BXZ73DRAFT_82588 [Epithele typhae]|uniref:uncharacterized protein n=1 Tax=Epithele typhae TaxID=378194 RepID=UPI002007BF4A|nr:uncharacterized protein BXZ73DRAFT_82588 [Epithele typhae]KAH9911813.1 hypothetical protein BXZ73DRAFT_82588 [Epithele typhae]